MKKLLSLLLACLMVMSLIVTMVACQEPEPDTPVDDGKPGDTTNPGKDPEGNPDKDPDDPEDPEDPEDPADPNARIPLDYLPTTGYNNASFHILEWSCNNVETVGMSWIPWEEGDVEQEDGDMLGTAVFERNAWVEQEFDVDISKEYAQIEFDPTYMTRIRNDATTSSDAYQLVTMRTVGIVPLIEDELLADMNDYSEYLHTDQPWWVQDAVKSFTLGSHLYVAASEMLLRDKGATAALFFNQVMAGDYDLPNLFDLVKNNSWTLEEMIYACETVAHPVGDDTMDSAEDIWGCTGGDDPVYYLFNAAGYKFAHIDEDGFIDYDFAEEGSDSVLVMQDIFEKFMYAEWYMNTGTNGAAFLEKDQDLFVEGTSLFKTGMVKDTTNRLKNMDDLYGILPYPMFDLDQEGYSSLVWEHHDSVLGIPSHAKNKEMCAVILEALSWESYYSVYPIFYETILLNRAARDQESKEMLQIIFATRSYDPGLYWDGGSGLHGGEGLLRLSKTGNSDIASLWARFGTTVETNIDQVNNWIADKED